ncbi:hypothetical protein A2U01_0057430, partial [Trifolium medium]|nr:hypothetical protein [Trifolium medium]
AIFKLLEVVTFLNGRECKYLEERYNARCELQVLGKKLEESEASCEGYREQHKILATDLKKAEEKMATLAEERDGALKQVEELKAKIVELEGKLQESAGAAVVGDDEKEVDLDGEYAASSRAALISKIH